MAWPSHLVAPDLLLLQCGALDGIDEITRNKLLIEPVAANKDENTRPNIPFEACVLIALVSLGGTAPMEKLLMRITLLFPFWGNAAITGPLYPRMGFVNPTAHGLKAALFYYDPPFNVATEDWESSAICSVTSADAAFCALRMLLGRAVNLLGAPSTNAPRAMITAVPSTQPAVSAQNSTSAVTTSRAIPPKVFMKLPPELRNRIYELVLVYPVSGINIMNENRNHHPGSSIKYIHTRTRDKDAHVPSYPWILQMNQYLNNRQQPEQVPGLRSYPFGTAVAILRVSPEIRVEASGIFYGCNRFHFDNLKELSTFLSTIKNDAGHIRKVDFTYETQQRTHALKAIRELGKLELLEHLSMKLRETTFQRYKGWEKVDDFKGLPQLRKHLERTFTNLKAFHLESICEGVLQYLKPALAARKNYQEL